MRKLSAIGLIAFMSVGAAVAEQKPVTQDVALATVPGVTLQSVRLGKGVLVPGSNASQATVSTAYADADGKTLYTFDRDTGGKSTCVGECAAAWPPFAAPANAKATGDWSVIVHDEGTSQWAHDGKPLYTSAKDKALGSSAGHNVHASTLLACGREPYVPAGHLVQFSEAEAPTTPWYVPIGQAVGPLLPSSQ